jgi:hypothetical protein
LHRGENDLMERELRGHFLPGRVVTLATFVTTCYHFFAIIQDAWGGWDICPGHACRGEGVAKVWPVLPDNRVCPFARSSGHIFVKKRAGIPCGEREQSGLSSRMSPTWGIGLRLSFLPGPKLCCKI